MSFYIYEILQVCEENPDVTLNGFVLLGEGSWRGSYDEPCVFISEYPDGHVTAHELGVALKALTSGGVYEGYKGGEYTYTDTQKLNFEPNYHTWSDGFHEVLIWSKWHELFDLVYELRKSTHDEK